MRRGEGSTREGMLATSSSSSAHHSAVQGNRKCGAGSPLTRCCGLSVRVSPLSWSLSWRLRLLLLLSEGLSVEAPWGEQGRGEGGNR